MENEEDRLRQEVEPAPVDCVDETVDAGLVGEPEEIGDRSAEGVDVPSRLVVADGFPFLGAGEDLRAGLADGAGGDLHRLLPREGPVGVGSRHVLRDRSEGAALFRDERGHPVMIGEADPAAALHLDHVRGRAPDGIGIEIGHVVVVDLLELAVGHADRALVDDEEAHQVLRLADPGDHAVRGEAHGLGARVLDRLLDGEHELLVDRHGAAEDEARGAVPRQRVAALDRPDCLGPGHVIDAERAAGDPSEERVIGLRGADRRQKPHLRRAGVEREFVILERQRVDAATGQRDRAAEAGRVDGHAGRFLGAAVTGGGRPCRGLGRRVRAR